MPDPGEAMAAFIRARYAEDRRLLLALSRAGDRWREANGAESRSLAGQGASMIAQAVDGDEDLAEALRPYVWASMPNDAARTLAEIDMKERILARHDDVHDCGDPRSWNMPYEGCADLRALASVYSGHPEYDESWRP